MTFNLAELSVAYKLTTLIRMQKNNRNTAAGMAAAEAMDSLNGFDPATLCSITFTASHSFRGNITTRIKI